MARRMYESGDWLHMEDNSGPFLNKPPVTFWMMATAFRFFGESSFAARLPALLTGLLLLFATVKIGQALWDRRTGLLAAAFVGVSPAFQLMVADPKVDMEVSAFSACVVWLLLEARRREWLVWPAWACAGLAILSKGPIGLAAPAVALLPELWRGPWFEAEAPGRAKLLGRLKRFRPLTGLLLMLLPMLPWYLQVVRENGARGPYFLLWEQSFGRLVGRSYRNTEGPFFFVHTMMWAFLPFTPVLLWELWRKAKGLLRERRLPPSHARVLVWWLVIPFVAISASSYKLPQYLYWLVSPAALISARALVEAAERGAVKSLRWLADAQVVVGFSLVALTYGLLELSFPPGSALAKLGWITLVVVPPAVGVWVCRRWEPPLRLAALGVLSLSAFFLFFHAYLHPALTAYQPDRRWGELARREDPRGKLLPFVGVDATNAAAFYAGREARQVQPEELARMVRAGEAGVAVLDPAALDAVKTQGLEVQPLEQRPSFATSKPSAAFMNASRRPSVLRQLVMVALKAGD